MQILTKPGPSSDERMSLEEIKVMRHEDYHIGWICALPLELAAAASLLDQEHPSLPQERDDANSYILGKIGQHNIVMACLPLGKLGIVSAAQVAVQMQRAFRSIRFGLLVGVGGGVPSDEHDIRLGDVVVSKPDGRSGGVIQYDYGATIDTGRFEMHGSLNKPPDVLLNALSQLSATHSYQDTAIHQILEESVKKWPRRRKACTSPGADTDILFRADYDHAYPDSRTCAQCDNTKQVKREPRDEPVAIHYGLIASGNQVMRNAKTREKLRKDYDFLCFEMEASGLMDRFPCLVIRGICDYSDSHKNKKWQDYAAATAAAYAKELLAIIPAARVADEIDIGRAVDQRPAERFHVSSPQIQASDDQRSRIRQLELELASLRAREQAAQSPVLQPAAGADQSDGDEESDDGILTPAVREEPILADRRGFRPSRDVESSAVPPVLSGHGSRLGSRTPTAGATPPLAQQTPVAEGPCIAVYESNAAVLHRAIRGRAANMPQARRRDTGSDISPTSSPQAMAIAASPPRGPVSMDSTQRRSEPAVELPHDNLRDSVTATDEDKEGIKRSLLDTINTRALQAFFPANSPYLDMLAQEGIANKTEYDLAQECSIRYTGCQDMFPLHDVVIFIDDSGSMEFEENGQRINQARTMVEEIVRSARPFTPSGTHLTFMNSEKAYSDVRSVARVRDIFARAVFRGLTPIGTAVRRKVVEQLFLRNLRTMLKPLLVFVITDGQPAGEHKDTLFLAIQAAKEHARTSSRFGEGAVTFQMVQVGNDASATEFITKLTTDLGLGQMVRA